MAGEVMAFRQERPLPPLPLARVSGLLQYTGVSVKSPQKLPAANVSAAWDRRGPAGAACVAVACCCLLCAFRRCTGIMSVPL